MAAEAGEVGILVLEEEEGVVQEEVVGVSDQAIFQIGGNLNVSGVILHIDV